MRQHLWRTILLALIFTLLLTGCGDPSLSALNPQGPVADTQLSLIKLSIYIMLLVIAVVTFIFIYVIIRFRQRPGDDRIPEQVEGSAVLETIWTAIPIVLLIILAVPTVMTTFSLAEPATDVETSAEAAEDEEAVEASEEGPLRVKVTAYQFWWQFEYPDHGIVTAQDLYIPTGEKVYFELTAEDVIHSFWVPALGGKMDTNPGLVNEMFLEADKPGVYQGKCAELCGSSHALMDFKVVALEPEAFDQWLASMSEYDGEKAETETAEQGREVFADNCISCHAVDGETPSLGPNLAGIADRETIAGYLPNDAQTMEDWIRHTDELKEGVNMPSFPDLSGEDMDALIEYLQGLTISE